MKKISDYYSEKIRIHGLTPKGVDWNSESSQLIRFEQLSKLIQSKGSLLDYGCGYAAFCKYLRDKNFDNGYTGFDISEDMIKNAKSYLKQNGLDEPIITSIQNQTFEYLIASGTFSVKLDSHADEWNDYIHEELKKFNEISIKGFAFNMLTSYSDIQLMREDLHYADPLYWFDFCKRNFSKNVALLHDYKLFEFTLIVRK